MVVPTKNTKTVCPKDCALKALRQYKTLCTVVFVICFIFLQKSSLDLIQTVSIISVGHEGVTNEPVIATGKSLRDQRPTLQNTTKKVGWDESTFPLANWTSSPDTQYELCFLTSVYSSSTKTSDRPPSVLNMMKDNPTFRFFAFTNLKNLHAPGWTVIEKNFPQYRRYITMSRWPKFMAWKEPLVSLCQAVIYMDGFCMPKEKHAERYKRMAKEIYDSKFGIYQNKHEDSTGPLNELDRILVRRKDIKINVEGSKAWLKSQSDFRGDATMYLNTFIGYNPKSIYWQKATDFFWEHYEKEEDSWRDQPLWAYTIDHFHITPKRLGTFEALFRQQFKNMGHGGHRYNDETDSNAKAI